MIRYVHPLKTSSFNATQANPAVRNSVILPVSYHMKVVKCTVFTMGNMPPFTVTLHY